MIRHLAYLPSKIVVELDPLRYAVLMDELAARYWSLGQFEMEKTDGLAVVLHVYAAVDETKPRSFMEAALDAACEVLGAPRLPWEY
jgi:hypothetical protein